MWYLKVKMIKVSVVDFIYMSNVDLVVTQTLIAFRGKEVILSAITAFSMLPFSFHLWRA
jgi:hypothetical protein